MSEVPRLALDPSTRPCGPAQDEGKFACTGPGTPHPERGRGPQSKDPGRAANRRNEEYASSLHRDPGRREDRARPPCRVALDVDRDRVHRDVRSRGLDMDGEGRAVAAEA